jgi:arginase
MLVRIAAITQPYNTQGKARGGGAGPDTLLAGNLLETIRRQGHRVDGPSAVQLSPAEESRYGNWLRVGAANAALADIVAGAVSDQAFALALCADCNSVLGVLGGLTRSSDPAWPRRVGLVWIDAHADYNTPETSPSGMLGGMPVATAAGKCLAGLRRQSGLRIPLQAPDILMLGLRDVDPPEQAMLTEDGVVCLPATDFVTGSERLDYAMRQLSAREDLIYVHVDLDILDPAVAPAAGLPSQGGITGAALGRGLAHLLAYPKVGALALVSYSPDRDPDGGTRAQVLEAITIATAGLPAG